MPNWYKAENESRTLYVWADSTTDAMRSLDKHRTGPDECFAIQRIDVLPRHMALVGDDVWEAY